MGGFKLTEHGAGEHMQEIKIIDKTESFWESLCSDIVTFSGLIFCILISRGSTWWTVFTSVLFLIFLFGRVVVDSEVRTHTFKTKVELLEWAISLDWPDKD